MTKINLQDLFKRQPNRTVKKIPSFCDTPDEGFNTRWALHRKPQATTEGVFWMKTGWAPTDMQGGQHILDAGCGIGRFAQVLQGRTSHIVCVDGSVNAVEACREVAPSAQVVQANLLDLPFKDGVFDKAYSIGVLHHTADPRAAFLEVARCVKPGGQLAVWLYCKPGTDEKNQAAIDLLHDITAMCPPKELHAAFAKHAVRLRDLYAGAWGPLEQVLRISNSLDDEECISDTFDWHTPKYRFWHTEDEVREWFTAAGFTVDWVGDFPVSMRGTKQ